MINPIEIYNKFLLKKEKENKAGRAKDNPDKMDASSAGLCMRKHYFKTNGAEQKPTDIDSLRLMRLGTIVGNELENVMNDALSDNLTIDYHQELLLSSDKLKVGGHLDFMLVEDGKGYVYDWKTAKAFKYRSMKKGTSSALNYEMQVATYGLLAVENGLCDSIAHLALVYYNKDTSEMFEHPVPLSAMKQAEAYWKEVMVHSNNLTEEPPEMVNKVPVYNWECGKYCNYSEICTAAANLAK